LALCPRSSRDLAVARPASGDGTSNDEDGAILQVLHPLLFQSFFFFFPSPLLSPEIGSVPLKRKYTSKTEKQKPRKVNKT